MLVAAREDVVVGGLGVRVRHRVGSLGMMVARQHRRQDIGGGRWMKACAGHASAACTRWTLKCGPTMLPRPRAWPAAPPRPAGPRAPAGGRARRPALAGRTAPAALARADRPARAPRGRARRRVCRRGAGARRAHGDGTWLRARVRPRQPGLVRARSGTRPSSGSPGAGSSTGTGRSRPPVRPSGRRSRTARRGSGTCRGRGSAPRAWPAGRARRRAGAGPRRRRVLPRRDHGRRSVRRPDVPTH